VRRNPTHVMLLLVASVVLSGCGGAIEKIDPDPLPPIIGTDPTTSNVTPTSVDLAWGIATDNLTADDSLQYIVYYSNANNISGVDAALANGTAFGTWETNLLATTVTGLADGVTYYFTVLVRDGSNNTAAYPTTTATLPDITSPTPGNGGTIVISTITGTTASLVWTAASDNATTTVLTYQSFYSTTSISTFAELAAAISGGTAFAFGAPTIDMTSVIIDGLAPSTPYYFNVGVQDSAGNNALYTMVAGTTQEGVPPVPGGQAGPDPMIAVDTRTDTTIDISWIGATDNLTPNASLQYLVYYSTTTMGATPLLVQANGTALGNWTADLTAAQLTPLANGTTYFFNVLVRDLVGNMAAYTEQSANTIDTTPPTLPGDISLNLSLITDTTATISWSTAIDNLTVEADLEYLVYLSITPSIDTLLNLDAALLATPPDHAWAIDTWAANINTKDLTGLTPGTTYHVNVVVRDEVPLRSIYAETDLIIPIAPVLTVSPLVYSSQAPNGTIRVEARVTDDGTLDVLCDMSILGLGTVTMLDNGTDGDEVAGDDIYSAMATIPDGTAMGAYTLTISALDNDSLLTQDTVSLDVGPFLLDYANARVTTRLSGGTLSLNWRIAADGPRVYAAWIDDRLAGGAYDVYTRSSLDGGLTWQTNDIQLSGSGSASSLHVACHGDHVYIVWVDNDASIRLVHSSNAGLGWSSMQTVSAGPIGITKGHPRVACSGEYVYVVWVNDTGATGDIHCNTSYDGGTTFEGENTVNVGAPVAGCSYPHIACSGRSLYVAWTDDRSGTPNKYFNCSFDAGQSWQGADQQLSVSTGLGVTNFLGEDTPLICEGSTVHCAWLDSRAANTQIYVNSSTDGGLTWGGEVQLDTSTTGGTATGIKAACSGDRAYVAWTSEGTNLGSHVYFRSSDDAGSSWPGNPTIVDSTIDIATCSFPSLACSGNVVCVAWNDVRDGFNLCSANISLDGGFSWHGSDLRLDSVVNGQGPAAIPRLACSGNDIYALFLRGGTTDGANLQHVTYMWEGTPGGSNDLLNDAAGTHTQAYHHIAQSGDRLYTVWTEPNGNGDNDVKVRVSSNGGVSWGAEADVSGRVAETFTCSGAKILASGRNAAIVWVDDRTADLAIQAVYLDESTSTWTAPVQITSSGIDVSVPLAVTSSGNSFYVAWHGTTPFPANFLFCNASHDGGASWSADSQVDSGTAGLGFQIALSCHGQKLYCLWTSNYSGDTNVYANRSEDGGTNWVSGDTTVSGNTGDALSGLALTCDTNRAYAVWFDGNSGVPCLNFSMTPSGGGAWTAEQQIDHAATPTALAYPFPAIACCGENVYAAWIDDRDTVTKLFFQCSRDSGTSWLASDSALGIGAEGTIAPHLANCGDVVVLAWYETVSSSLRGWIRTSNDGATSWSDPIRMDSATSIAFTPIGPLMTIEGTEAHGLWLDDRANVGMEFDLYYNFVK